MITQTTTNEAAERLLAEFIGGNPEAVQLFDAAMAAKGRATVERIRAAVQADVKISSKQSQRRMLAILDEEAAR